MLHPRTSNTTKIPAIHTTTRCRRHHGSILVAAIVMLLSSSRVQCSWVSRSLFPKRSQQVYSQVRLLASWKVGESVIVKTNDLLEYGVIQEVRGGGWYSVRLATNESIIKCRTTQLGSVSTSSSAVTTRTSLPRMFSAPNPERPMVHPDAGTSPEFPPPPPTIYDLDAALLDMANITNPRDQEFLEQIQHHSQYETWVVFTDLHCSSASLETCLQVLTRVHELAVERDAGVLFLGDFWHHRGTLRVDCLNAVLRHFQDWQVPMVMIPGNHDQVSLNGHSHSLTPLENAYRVGNIAGPLIFSHPTKFRQALFVPHIREVATMESVLQSSLAQAASALFVHADVTGALMNDLIVSLNGIPPASFPVHKLIYSGHFHKAHTVKAGDNIRIEYLGSPYETSLAEAQQAKTLAILDKNWECIEYVPMDIGRRHFKVTSWDELCNLHLQEHEEESLAIVRSGDRIVASIPRSEMDSLPSKVEFHVRELREAGVMVEIREIKTSPEHAMGSSLVGGEAEKLEEMTPESTWRLYLAEELGQRETLDKAAAERLLEAGLEILNELEASEESQTARTTKVTDLALEKVSVEGFGPFRDKVTYPLLNRGLVLLKGTNNDVGSDSNGSGKTSLAMAALWALTGSMDPRRALDGKVSDVVHDDSKTARVTLDGTLNGLPFTISRSKTLSKTNLFFQLNGVELTTQSAKETQALIEEHLGVSGPVLSRTMFHGQHAVNELLEATDAKLKEELSLLVPLGIWQAAASRSRAKSKEAGKRIAEYEGMIAMRAQDVDRLSLKKNQAEANVQQMQNTVGCMEAEFEKASASINAEPENDIQDLQVWFSNASSDVVRLETEYKQMRLQAEASLKPLRSKFQSASNAYDAAMRLVQDAELSVFGARLNLNNTMEAIKSMEQKWSIDISAGNLTDVSAPNACPTCGQPIHGDEGGHSHEDFEIKLMNEIKCTVARRDEAQEKLDLALMTFEDRQQVLKTRKDEVVSIEAEIESAVLSWDNRISELEKTLASTSNERNRISETIASAARRSQKLAKHEMAIANIKTEKASLQHALGSLSDILEELEDVERRVKEMCDKMEEETIRVRTMNELAERFGQRGVQTFVLQNIVEVLQACSQTYLDDLSDGAQRIELSLDAGDRISRTAFVLGADGTLKERPLATLSGGQWRRCSLAVTLGFAEIVARKGKFRPSMCVLDEPLTHLDQSGRSKVGDVIRKMLRPSCAEAVTGFGVKGMSTVVLILQDLAAEELDEAFDHIDEVVKENSASIVKLDGFLSE